MHSLQLFEILDSQKQLIAEHVQVIVLIFLNGGARFFPVGVKCADAGFFVCNRQKDKGWGAEAMSEPLGDQLPNICLVGVWNDNVLLFGQRNVKDTLGPGNFKAEPFGDMFYIRTESITCFQFFAGFIHEKENNPVESKSTIHAFQSDERNIVDVIFSYQLAVYVEGANLIVTYSGQD